MKGKPKTPLRRKPATGLWVGCQPFPESSNEEVALKGHLTGEHRCRGLSYQTLGDKPAPCFRQRPGYMRRLSAQLSLLLVGGAAGHLLAHALEDLTEEMQSGKGRRLR
jgi:hypothetical protein